MIPPWIYAAGGAMIAVIAFGSGWQVRAWKADSDELKQFAAGVERGKEQQQLVHLEAARYEEESNDAAAASVERQTEIRTIYRTEQIAVAAECEPPAGVASLLHAAVGAANARARGEPGGGLPTAPGAADTASRP
jgi:hypothetical protein